MFGYHNSQRTPCLNLETGPTVTGLEGQFPMSRAATLPASQASNISDRHQEEIRDEFVNLQPPMLVGARRADAIAKLTHLPMAGLPSGTSKRGRKGGKGKRARDGQVVSKMYNELASRPYPTNGLSLEQAITVSLTITDSVLTTNTTLPQFSSKYVTLSDFAAASALTNVFDQYKFDQVEAWLEPYAAQGTTVFNDVCTAVDLDDANSPTSFYQVTDKIGALTGYGGCGRYHKWKPHMAVAVYSGLFNSFGNTPADWIDSASTNVQHYGLKVAFGPTPVAVQYRLTLRATISFRAPVIQ